MTPDVENRTALGFAGQVLETEARLLSAGRHDPVAMHNAAVAEGLVGASFAESLHAALFTVLCGCARRRHTPTLADARRLLARAGVQLNGESTPDRLDSLWHLECSAAGVTSWAHFVADFARRRTEASEMVRKANETLAEVLPAAEPTDGSAPVLVRVADVQPERVRWLWPHRIALGKLALIAGDPGLGKSLITLDAAARVSRGTPWPDAQHTPNPAGGVVLLSAEDDVADTIRPRLDAAGADVTRIVVLEAVKHRDPETGAELSAPFCLASDLPSLELAVERVRDCRVVVIDPITAYLGRIDSHKNADLRAALAPLSELAGRHHVAVVAVTHLRKSEGPAVYRAMGSLAFTAAARAVWAVTKDRDDPRRRLVLPIKNNLAGDVLGLAYTIERSGDAGAPVIAWAAEPVYMLVDDALAFDRGDADGRTDREQAADWLRDALADGPMRSTDVIAQAKENGIAEKTLRRAFRDMGGKPHKASFDGGWYWRLPGDDREVGPEDSQDAQPPDVGNFGEVGHLGGDDNSGGRLRRAVTEGWAD